MACHLAGITTAVATCGTAFGDDHARVLRRFMLDHEEFRGEVVFTFDGDEAGQKAAERAFSGDQNFASQTYVAVEPSGMDPCDLRLAQGDEAVRELIARRVPLYRFVLGRIVGRFDLDRADGRIDALREAAKLVTSVRDRSKVEAFTRELAQMIGVEVDEARAEVRRALARGPQKAPDRAAPQHRTEEAAPQAPKRQLPPLRDARFAIERETLKLVVQHPGAVGRTIDDVDADDFTHPTYRTVWELAAAAGGVTAGSADPAWVARLRDGTTDEVVARALGELATEPLVGNASPDPAYVNAHVLRLQELTVQRRIADLKSKLQRTNPVDAADDYNRLFGELMVLEQQRRTLRERAIGG
ncbi:toprim domain-containing protein [Nocardioides zeae]